jgi:hypothetical protein
MKLISLGFMADILIPIIMSLPFDPTARVSALMYKRVAEEDIPRERVAKEDIPKKKRTNTV